MANITEHDSKQEWECDASKHSWVYLLVVRDTVSVDNVLEGSSEFISLEHGGWLNIVAIHQLESGNLNVSILLFDLLN
jgi:hypothetical protein